jgi:CubicO group peptidase (beta-lactamase class C family)
LGSFVNYSNASLTLAGRVLEVVTGQTYRDAMEDLVLDRLGLNSTFDILVVKNSVHARSHGVTATGTLEEPKPDMPRHIDPAGGLWSSIDDLTAYGRMHLGGGRVLSPTSIAAMQTPSRSVQGMPASAFGVSWLITDFSFGRAIEHTGGTPGQSALLFIVPGASFVLAVLTNSNSGGAVVEAVRQAAKRVFFGSSEETLEAGQNLPALTLSPSDLAAYAGTYRTPLDEIQLQEEQGRLRLSHRRTPLSGQVTFSTDMTLPTLPVDIVAYDIGILGGVENGGRPIHFLRRPDGSIGWLSMGMRLMVRQ